MHGVVQVFLHGIQQFYPNYLTACAEKINDKNLADIQV